VPPPEPLTEKPPALTGPAGSEPPGTEQAVKDLVAAGDRSQLEKARAELVRRLSGRSDDFEATAALTVVNKALAGLGWDDPYNWKHRRKP
jgi:sirohydrochlorin ferrochelatase